MFLLGLTGSIGMGKSSVGEMFKKQGIEVVEADEVVHRLYQKGGRAVYKIQQLFPSAISEGAVDRQELSKCVVGNGSEMKKLEQIVHPLVIEEREKIIQDAKERGLRLLILDIPLLFETKMENDFDGILVVSAPSDVQRQRVLQRPGMTEEKFEYILKRQMSDEEKREKADFVIDTSLSQEQTEDLVRTLIKELLNREQLQ
eukprot:TRINITY_DN63811_c0_g1_i4.p2 TRINITY_DN63811_c0_g1~~TRINITY_DN63811_c0_g1_i4.p2  ORF type:complete len:201 (-),score=28.39 TRINITY_DN63811_c0_g1_i4:123-725(-)